MAGVEEREEGEHGEEGGDGEDVDRGGGLLADGDLLVGYVVADCEGLPARWLAGGWKKGEGGSGRDVLLLCLSSPGARGARHGSRREGRGLSRLCRR